MGKKKTSPKTSRSSSGNKDIITGNWEIDTLGTMTSNPGGIIYRTGMKTADKNIRFGDDIIYRDLDASMTFTTQDKYLGYIVSSAPTTGKTGTFTQNSIGSPEYSFFADALEGAKAGYIVLTSNPW